MPLDSSITTIKGVGDKRQQVLRKMGIKTIGDILYHAPFKYQQISDAKFLSQFSHGDEAVVKAEVTSKPILRRMQRNFSIVTFNISDGQSTGRCIFFNQPYMAKNIYKGSSYIFIGKIDAKHGVKQIQNPTLEKLDADLLPVICTYKLINGISQKIFKKLVKKVLEQELGTIEEVLPSTFRKKHNLPEINYAFEHLHFPDSRETAQFAKYRFSFEEMLLFMVALENLKKENESLPAYSYNVDDNLLQRFYSSLPFELTGAQKRVISEITTDMMSTNVMNRLLQGDVGSGKTIPAAVAMLIAAKNSKQSAMMAPTDILASQHYGTISKLLAPFDIKIALLKSKISAPQKHEILNNIKNGDIDIVIGTHALIQKSVVYKELGLVITDEQHRFGVSQRATITSKGLNPDTLVMSATPVPRTLALILYGDLSISIIDEMPLGRKPVKTRIVDTKKRLDMYNYVKNQLQGDTRAYIVCPLIDESEKLEVKSTSELLNELSKDIFHDTPIEILTGRHRPEEKEDIMQRFKSGEIKCIISTTVIEVGVDVPEATIMVIENAERFGLAQLHQLRGRVGRGNLDSWCFLVTETDQKIAKKRLEVMTTTNDGFKVAKEDLKMRGPGQFIGLKQSGMMDPRVLSLMGDVKLLAKVKEAINTINNNDNMAETECIKKIAKQRYYAKLQQIILN